MEDNNKNCRGAEPPEEDPAGPPFSRSRRLVYLQCPCCRRTIEHPFNPQGGVQVYVHRHPRRSDARLMVFPNIQKAVEIPHNVSMEEALRDAIDVAS